MNEQEKGNFLVQGEYRPSQIAEVFLSKYADEKSAIFPRGFC
ncbi:MAG: hypothetical protein WC647_01925 [Desulfomonilaceae bacterium]|jgi:hypothetical protein